MSKTYYYTRINQNNSEIHRIQILIDRQELAKTNYTNYMSKLEDYHNLRRIGKNNIALLVEKIQMSTQYVSSMEKQLGTSLTNKIFAMSDLMDIMEREIQNNYNKITSLHNDTKHCNDRILEIDREIERERARARERELAKEREREREKASVTKQ